MSALSTLCFVSKVPNPRKFGARVVWCLQHEEELNQDPQSIHKVLFSHEAKFYLNHGKVNMWVFGEENQFDANLQSKNAGNGKLGTLT